MISPEHKKILQEMNSTQYGAVLKIWLEEKRQQIESVVNIPKEADFAAEVKGRQMALVLLEEIFNFMEATGRKQKDVSQYE